MMIKNNPEKRLKQKIKFGEIISKILLNFVDIKITDINKKINKSLKMLGQSFDADRCYIFELKNNEKKMDNTYEWCHSDTEPQKEMLQNLGFETIPWWMEKLKKSEIIYIPWVNDLPEAASSERKILKAQSIKSVIVVPLFSDKTLFGFIGFDFTRSARDYSMNIVETLRITGSIIAAFISKRDIELREKKAYNDLVKSQYFASRILNSSPIPTLVINPDTSIRYINKALIRLTGFSTKEIIGRKAPYPWWIEQKKKQTMKKLDLAFKQKFNAERLNFQKKNGHKLIVDITSIPVNIDGKFDYYLSSWVDVTEKVKSEEEISSLSQFRQSVIDSANIWISVLDTGENVSVWNRAAEKISGYTKNEVVGNKNIWQWLYPDKKYREKITTKAARIIKGGKAVDNFEAIIRCRDGSEKIISWNYKNLTDGTGDIIGSINIGKDITERKEKERFINIHRNLASALGGISDLNKALKVCIDTIIKETDMDCGGFYILDNETGNLELKYSKGLSRKFVSRVKTMKKNSNQTALVIKGKPVYKFYPKLVLRMDPVRKKEELKASGIIPIKYNGKVIGCLNIASHKVDDIKDFSKSILELIANEIGATLIRLRDRKKIEDSEERYRTLVETLPTRIWSKDKNSTYISCNKALADNLEIKKEDIAGNTDYDFFPKEEADNCRKGDLKVIKSGKTLDAEESLTRHGKTMIVHTIKAPLRNGKGNICGTLGMFWDITDRKKIEEELKDSEEKFKIMFESAPDAYYLNDLKGNFIDGNSAAEKILGYKREELIGKNFLRANIVPPSFIPKMVKLLALNAVGLQSTGPDEIILNRKDGRRVIVEVSTHPVKIKNKHLVLGIARDITDRKKAEENLKFLSFHDKLTRVYNRAYFEEELARIDSGRQLPISIIMGDLNGLKLVNDAFGHKHGDKLLINTATVLKKCCRKDDIVARYGGDEFAIILPGTSASLCGIVLKRIKNAIGRTKDQKIPLSVSLGAATKEKKATDINEILSEAENNMYTGKLLEEKSISGSIVSSLTETLWQKDIETREHAARLKNLALKMGERLKLPASQLANLSLLATLHDIGKLSIPDKILKKEDKLTKSQWQIVKRHPEVGSRIAQASPMLLPIANLILSHHEWWDGSGYPIGIKGKRIPLESRIISIMDAYDVMRTGRPYKKKLTREEAIKELKDCSGTQFDPMLVNEFIDMIG